MIKFLIIYSTTDGHTKIICERIKNFLTDGNLVELLSLEDAKKINLSNFEKIIIGSSIRYGKHSKDLYKFINLKKKNNIFRSFTSAPYGWVEVLKKIIIKMEKDYN